MSNVFFRVDLSIRSYRHAVSTVIPRTTKVAWHLQRRKIQNSDPSETKTKFIYNISKSGYRKEWGGDYEKPGFFARFKAFLSHLVPKIGPFSALAFHPPTPAVEQIYMHSFNETLNHYRLLLLAQVEGILQLPNDNLDTGGLAEPADYRLTDETYAKLLVMTNGRPISDTLRRDILDYYADPEKKFATKKDPEAWQKVLNELDRLKAMPNTGAPKD
jgi:hypothetical protein